MNGEGVPNRVETTEIYVYIFAKIYIFLDKYGIILYSGLK